LAFGFVVVGDPIVWSNVLGLAVALAGMVLYAKAEMLDRAAAAASPQHPSTKSSSGDEESNSK
jgi:drug/metabolite transporter (DMT)-like permease